MNWKRLLVCTAVTLGLGLTSCGHRARTASGPAFAPTPASSGKSMLYFYRPDKFGWSGITINLGVVPVPGSDAEAVATKFQKAWDDGKDSVSLGDLLEAAAKGAAEGAVSGATSGLVNPGKKGKRAEGEEIPNCWALDNNGFVPVEADDGALILFNSGGSIHFKGVKFAKGAPHYFKVEPVDSGFSFDTELGEVPEQQALAEMKESRGVSHCKSEAED